MPFKVECQLNLRRWYCVQNDNVERLFQLTVHLEVAAMMVSTQESQPVPCVVKYQ